MMSSLLVKLVFGEASTQRLVVAQFWLTQSLVNPFHANIPFLYPLKTSENIGHWREKG